MQDIKCIGEYIHFYFERTDYKGVAKLAPQFTKAPVSVVASKGDIACFCARVQCGKPIEITWTINGRDVKENPRCKVCQSVIFERFPDDFWYVSFSANKKGKIINGTNSPFTRSKKTTAWVFSGYTTCNSETSARYGAQHPWLVKGRRSVARPSYDWIDPRTKIETRSRLWLRPVAIAATPYEEPEKTLLLRRLRCEPDRYLEDPRRVLTCPLCLSEEIYHRARYSTESRGNCPRKLGTGKMSILKNSRVRRRNECTGKKMSGRRRTRRRRSSGRNDRGRRDYRRTRRRRNWWMHRRWLQTFARLIRTRRGKITLISTITRR